MSVPLSRCRGALLAASPSASSRCCLRGGSTVASSGTADRRLRRSWSPTDETPRRPTTTILRRRHARRCGVSRPRSGYDGGARPRAAAEPVVVIRPSSSSAGGGRISAVSAAAAATESSPPTTPPPVAPASASSGDDSSSSSPPSPRVRIRALLPPPHALKSSNEGGAGSDSDVSKATSHSEFISDHLIDPGRAVFPWRHSPSPLPRLVPDDPAHLSEGGALGPGVPPVNRYLRWTMRANAAAVLGVPAWRILLTPTAWEEELAGQFARAFEVGVAGMLANTYGVPVEQISRREEDEDEGEEEDGAEGSGRGSKDGANEGGGGGDNFAVDFDQTLDPLPEITDIKEEMEAEERERAEGGHREECPEIEYMLERHLRTLYQTAHEHARHKLQICLRTTSTSAQLESLLFLPCLTREHVEQTPALRHSYRNIYKHLGRREQELGRRLNILEIVREVTDEFDKLARRTAADDGGRLESTVVAQVSIRCDEVFTVRDVDLDEVVQGDPESRTNDVVHLVRFEMVVRGNADGTGEMELGSWQITDWDDLLGGNVWFI